MGYDLFIERPEGDSKITEAEWRAYVASDPTLVMEGDQEVTSPSGDKIVVRTPLLARWEFGALRVPFNYRKGKIVVTFRTVNGAVLTKMLEIAALLGAKVMGEGDEEYTVSERHGMDE
jgi:hypothetical protein